MATAAQEWGGLTWAQLKRLSDGILMLSRVFTQAVTDSGTFVDGGYMPPISSSTNIPVATCLTMLKNVETRVTNELLLKPLLQEANTMLSTQGVVGSGSNIDGWRLAATRGMPANNAQEVDRITGTYEHDFCVLVDTVLNITNENAKLVGSDADPGS